MKKQKNETIFWEGRPETGHWFSQSDYILIPLSLLWTYVALYWVFRMTRDTTVAYNFLFGSLFIVSGLYLVIGRFVMKENSKKQTLYRISSKGITFIQKEGETKNIIPFQEIDTVEWKPGKNGVGTIWFIRHGKKPNSLVRMISNAGLDFLIGEEKEYGFFDIREAETVAELIRHHLHK